MKTFSDFVNENVDYTKMRPVDMKPERTESLINMLESDGWVQTSRDGNKTIDFEKIVKTKLKGDLVPDGSRIVSLRYNIARGSIKLTVGWDDFWIHSKGKLWSSVDLKSINDAIAKQFPM